MADIPLARAVLDRAAHRRADDEWLAAAWSRARLVVVDTGAGVAAVDEADGLVLRGTGEAPTAAAPGVGAWFLGVDGEGTPYFAVDAPLAPSAGQRLAGLRDAAHVLSPLHADLLVTALGIAHWHARHRYAARSGTPTTAGEAGWSHVDAEGARSWPRTDPAVIMLLWDGRPGTQGQCLLAVGAGWDNAEVKRFSCLAGFVEPGESAESAVAREVGEEVGVAVGDIRYVGSQPWPYPSSLMLGFLAEADPATPLRPDPAEIAEARWFTRAEVAAVRAGETLRLPDGARVAVTDNASISASLVNHWLAG
ncbi:putative NADH pyrophosphatase/NUDIX hydrolase [Pilimelia terevasa]|uniref:NAD(+) diphosphatase n=1 Tax=Pilimelia terevasa TaxID=53372 RepID=A0A8J3BF76_9ACTN|nr:NAD(+) diphosphatase [Pilimelia terevasa]GGK17012.1 putative NADH pyrophosphatase/NUDIX hydrolase [Pilimelia terevasa]